ncbi:response regulator [Microbacterium sp.]|uniref:response regulator transcription factor n=1 Tax=Microbacterium sp. TaxID=51671 RepID=UPI0025EB1892|nr:response regulator [Microbacterium sp.]
MAEHRPDLVITDIRLPPGNADDGLAAALRIRRTNPEIAVVVLSQYVQRSYAEELVSLATEVLGLVAEGRSNAPIAGALYLSEKAVVQHVSRIYDSLGLDADDADAHRRVQAVLQYLDHS